MRRDSVFGEPVEWSGEPKVLLTPMMYRISSLVGAITAAAAIASAVVVSSLGAPVGQLVLFAAWSATLSIAAATGPRWWRSRLVYEVTRDHIVVKRGRFHRSIERRAISYARIRWHAQAPGTGDLELVRAVPTGALRRRLTIVLPNLAAPDRVWAIIRGVPMASSGGDGHVPLAQRLDEDERVLWSGRPAPDWRAWVPGDARGKLQAVAGLGMFALAVLLTTEAGHGVSVARGAGLEASSVPFIALVVSIGLSMLLLAAVASTLVYASVVRPARLDERTRYFVTNRRVLIQRGDEELHLDRRRIVEVIGKPCGSRKIVYFVLDGPRSVAVAASGAFGETQSAGLLPVFHRVDAEAMTHIAELDRAEAELVAAPSVR